MICALILTEVVASVDLQRIYNIHDSAHGKKCTPLWNSVKFQGVCELSKSTRPC